jgi:hypothetical protein
MIYTLTYRIEKYKEKTKQIQFLRFINGFKDKQLLLICKYYNLIPADINQRRCLLKVIKKSNLTYQDIWTALINIKNGCF